MATLRLGRHPRRPRCRRLPARPPRRRGGPDRCARPVRRRGAGAAGRGRGPTTARGRRPRAQAPAAWRRSRRTSPRSHSGPTAHCSSSSTPPCWSSPTDGTPASAQELVPRIAPRPALLIWAPDSPNRETIPCLRAADRAVRVALGDRRRAARPRAAAGRSSTSAGSSASSTAPCCAEPSADDRRLRSTAGSRQLRGCPDLQGREPVRGRAAHRSAGRLHPVLHVGHGQLAGVTRPGGAADLEPDVAVEHVESDVHRRVEAAATPRRRRSTAPTRRERRSGDRRRTAPPRAGRAQRARAATARSARARSARAATVTAAGEVAERLQRLGGARGSAARRPPPRPACSARAAPGAAACR